MRKFFKKLRLRIFAFTMMLGAIVLFFPIWCLTGVDVLQEVRDFMKEEELI